MAAFLSPVFGAGVQLFNNQGIVLAGGTVTTYQAGTANQLGTWTDSTQAVANANPMTLDSSGRTTQEIWLTSGSQYKFIVRDSLGNQIAPVFDNISGINDVSNPALSEWVATGLTPSYISPTSFSVAGNNTAFFAANRRVKIAVAAGTCYGYVVSSTFNGTITTVVIGVDSIGLDAGISAVSVGLLNSTQTSVPQQFLVMSAPVNVASAATTPIGAAPSVNVNVTGTVTITAFDTITAGILRYVTFTGSLLLTYNAVSLILPGAANIQTTAGDSSIWLSLGSGNWQCIHYTPSYGIPIAFPSGTRIAFQQTTVPTGWTKDTTAALNDSAMRIVTGTAGSGGTLGLSTASTGTYALQIADMPSHTHTLTLPAVTGTGIVAASATWASLSTVQSNPTATTAATGTGTAHSHPLALKYYDFSIGTKN